MPIFFSEEKEEDLKWRISKWFKVDSQILTRCPCWLVWFLKSLPHRSIGDHRPEEECDPLELELQVFVGRPAWVLELVVWESSRSSLHCPTMLLSALWFYSLRHKCLWEDRVSVLGQHCTALHRSPHAAPGDSKSLATFSTSTHYFLKLSFCALSIFCLNPVHTV